MAHPNTYKSLRGLLRATERVLSDSHKGLRDRFDGQSRGMWLLNAEYMAATTFGDSSGIRELRRKWSTSRAQDLEGGHAVFGFPLPRRDYNTGDTVPGCGLVQEVLGDQLRINGAWYHKSCFASQPY